jgi:hypothetical protein
MARGKRRTLTKRKAKLIALKKIQKPRKQHGGLGPAAGMVIGMALPMLLNSGTSIVGSLFGKKPAQRPASSVNQRPQQQRQQYRPPPQPQWMNSDDYAPPQPRRRRNYYDDDY